ncbi:MAG: hypothetical protein R3E02_06695 [Blastomonas sp.]
MMRLPLSNRTLSLLAAAGATMSLAACWGGAGDDNGNLTETEMGDVDQVEGTISDALPNFDTEANPANGSGKPAEPGDDAKPANASAETPATQPATAAGSEDAVIPGSVAE